MTARLEGRCPRCGFVMDDASEVQDTGDRVEMVEESTTDGGAVPKAGDYSVCIHCAGANIYDDGGKLRMPTREEMKEMRGDERVRNAIQAIMLMHLGRDQTRKGFWSYDPKGGPR